jgi:hypothetical protein
MQCGDIMRPNVGRPRARSDRAEFQVRGDRYAPMDKIFEYVDFPNMRYLMKGLTFTVSRCAEVLDKLLVGFNKDTQIPDRIVSWNAEDPSSRSPLHFTGRGRFIVEINELLTKKGRLHTVQLLENSAEKEPAPVVFLKMHSPSLNIPMRTEIPLRSLIKGGASLRDTYSVYLHALLCDDGRNFTYYGITKRGWNVRWNEHALSAIRSESQRLFPLKLKKLMEARVAQLYGSGGTHPRLTGIISAICGVGLTEDQAMESEEYLVNKYSDLMEFLYHGE